MSGRQSQKAASPTAPRHVSVAPGKGNDPAAQQSVDAPGSGAPLAKARNLLSLSRFFGRLSAAVFLLAALAVVDALQTLIRHDFNAIDLVPGETVLISGMLPADAKSHDELEVAIEGETDIGFTPVETYKGFWMGGHMWRAELSAPSGARPGKAVITLKDIIPPPAEHGEAKDFDARDRAVLFGGRQNPALVFGITVWPSEKERRAGEHSFVRRYTGFPAFGVAAAAVFLAIAAGFANWRVFGRAEEALGAHGVFFIHGLKDISPPADNTGVQMLSGYKAAFARTGKLLVRGEEMILLDRDWKERGRGRIVETDPVKGYAMFPHSGVRPQYGWLVMKSSAAEGGGQRPETEGGGPV